MFFACNSALAARPATLEWESAAQYVEHVGAQPVIVVVALDGG